MLILLFTAYGARVLVLKVPSRAFKSEVIYSGKILIVEETHDKKKEELKPKISGEKKMYEEVHLGFDIGLRFRKSDVSERTFSGSKVCPAQTTFRQLPDNLNYI